MALRPRTTEEEKALQKTRSDARGEGKLTPTRQDLVDRMNRRKQGTFAKKVLPANELGPGKALYPPAGSSPENTLNLSPPQIGQPVSYGDAAPRTIAPEVITPTVREEQTEGILSRFGKGFSNFVDVAGPIAKENLQVIGTAASRAMKDAEAKRGLKFDEERQLRSEVFGIRPESAPEGMMPLQDGQVARITEEEGNIRADLPSGYASLTGGRQLSPTGERGSYGVMPSSNALGVDTSKMSREDRAAFNVKSYNDAADKVKADREAQIVKERGGRMSPSRSGGIGAQDRKQILREYKRDLRSVMSETGQYGGSKKAKIAAVNQMYKNILGLGQEDQAEAGRNYRSDVQSNALTEREGLSQAGQMARARMDADQKDNKVEIDLESGLAYKMGAEGPIWVDSRVGPALAEYDTLKAAADGDEKKIKELNVKFLTAMGKTPDELRGGK